MVETNSSLELTTGSLLLVNHVAVGCCMTPGLLIVARQVILKVEAATGERDGLVFMIRGFPGTVN